jgi:hypothetical protein
VFPVDGPKIATVNEHRTARELELSVGPCGHAGIGPGHPGMSFMIGIEEDRPLGQISIALAE